MIRKLPFSLNRTSPPKAQAPQNAVSSAPSAVASTQLPTGDRADIELKDIQERRSAAPAPSKTSFYAMASAAALLGLTGLGFFQGGTANQVVAPSPEVEMVTETKQAQQASPEILSQMEVTPHMLVAGRQGQLLGPGKIMKFDQYPGLQGEKLNERIPGAPNFRQVAGTEVYGVAQPTVDGIRAVLDRTGGKENPVVWTNMREEPVVYINGRSFSLREEAHPFENADDFVGASAQSVDRTEQQLKAEILAEAKANGGRFLVHGESQDGVTTEWVEINPDSVQTTNEVFQQIQSEGYKVDFARVPVTDEKTPETADLQELVKRVTGAESGSSFIFNCHAGRGRTTTAMVAAQMLQQAQNPKMDTDAVHHMDSVRQDIKEQGNYDQGNYRLILSLIKKLDNGVGTKSETDALVDRTEDMQNLRRDINRYREKSLSAETPLKAQQAESRGLDYLHRYHTLITFNQYAKEQAPKGFELTFDEWLEERPELNTMLESFELAMNTPSQQTGPFTQPTTLNA